MAWAFLYGVPGHDNGADRRALEQRAEELTAHALAPGSALPCLDAAVGDDVEAACEKSLFASPASVAVASSYVTARLALLSDIVAFVGRGGSDIDSTLLPLRHAVEADRFGFLAHALAVRDGCTSEDCKALAPLRDAGHVRDNLGASTFDRYLDRYLTVWNQSADAPVADASMPASTAQPPHKIVNIDFPTAASIPAVSIMNPEPNGKAASPTPATAAANANPPAVDTQAGAPPAPPPKKGRKQAANPPPAPSPAPAEPPVDPVWTPAPAASQAATVPATAAAPMQLMPSSSPQ
jgi:hypothetical protein